MIKRKDLAEKVEEQIATGTFHERRADKPFWRSRIGSVHKWGHFFTRAVFLCGQDVFYADILGITLDPTPQGIADVVESPTCYNIECKFSPKDIELLDRRRDDKKLA